MPRGGTAAAGTRARTLGLAVLAVALAVGVHVFELHGRFVYDDLVYVVYNAAVQRGLGADWTRFFTDHTLYSGVVHTVHYRPLVALSYAANASPDLTSFAFKVTQVALHALTVLGLFWSLTVLRRHRPEVPAAVPFLAAAWVGIVPFNVEAVHYVAARSSLMCGTFAAWAFGLYLRMRLASRSAAVAGWYVAHLLAVGAALSCKETALALPAAMVAADLWLVRPGSTAHRMQGLRPWWPYLPYVAGLAFVLLVMPNVNHTYGYLHRVFTDPWRLAIAFWCLVENLRLMVLGTGLTAVHPVDPDAGLLTPTTAGVLVLLLALAAGCWAVRRRLPLVGFGYLWYLFLIAPSTFVHLNQILQEHRAYTASFGVGMALAALAGALWERAARHRRAVFARVVAGIAAVGLVLAVGAVHRERVWASGLALWSDAAAHAPGSYLARINLGLMRMNAGDLKGAERELRWAFDSKPSPHARHGLAQVLGREGRYREALDLLAPMVETFPDDPRVLFEVARARVGMGAGAEAVESLKRLDAAERENLRTRRYKYLYRPGATAAELVRVALAAGRLDDARWGVARLREEAPDDPTGDRMAFAVHLAAGEIEAAEADLAALDRRLPGDPRVAALRARLEAAKTGPSGPPPAAP